MGKLVGYKYLHSKKTDKDFCVAVVLSEFSKNEKESGSVGQKVEELFMPDDLYNFLKPEHIGKEFVPSYEISNGRAYLVGVTVK